MLVVSNRYPIGNELDQKVFQLEFAAAPYHVVPDVTKAAQNTAATLLESRSSFHCRGDFARSTRRKHRISNQPSSDATRTVIKYS